MGGLRRCADRLSRSICLDGGAECICAVWILEEPYEDGLMAVWRATWADDVGGSFDEGLLHDSEPEVGERYEPVSEDDLPSPLLEGGEEHSRSRGDGAEVTVGFAQLDPRPTNAASRL